MVVVGVDLFVHARHAVGVVCTQHHCVVVVVEDVHHGSPVPVVCDAPAVVNVTSRVTQHLSRVGRQRVYFFLFY